MAQRREGPSPGGAGHRGPDFRGEPRPWLFKAGEDEGGANEEHLAHPDKRGGERRAPVPTLPQRPVQGPLPSVRYVARGAEGRPAALAPRKLTFRGRHSHVDKP